MSRISAVILVLAVAGGGLACRKAPVIRVTEQELVGTYVARTKELGRDRIGTIRLDPGGTYVHAYQVDGRQLEQSGTWTLIQSASGTQVKLAGFVADWQWLKPATFQTPVERYGDRLALVADPDIGFYFVKSEP